MFANTIYTPNMGHDNYIIHLTLVFWDLYAHKDIFHCKKSGELKTILLIFLQEQA